MLAVMAFPGQRINIGQSTTGENTEPIRKYLTFQFDEDKKAIR